MTISIPKPKKKTDEEKFQEKIAKRREDQARWRKRAIQRRKEKVKSARKQGIGYKRIKKSKRVNQWNQIRQKTLKPMFEKLGITYCEVSYYLYSHGQITEEQMIERSFAKGFHHRHKRDWYKTYGKEKEKELLGDFNQVILVGQHYHDELEYNEKLTEQWFNALRGKEIIWLN